MIILLNWLADSDKKKACTCSNPDQVFFLIILTVRLLALVATESTERIDYIPKLPCSHTSGSCHIASSAQNILTCTIPPLLLREVSLTTLSFIQSTLSPVRSRCPKQDTLYLACLAVLSGSAPGAARVLTTCALKAFDREVRLRGMLRRLPPTAGSVTSILWRFRIGKA